ncbi:MAG: site-specific integrase, partial [Clostridia bacterium]|nr:site-specific integrase [Clostridia bacterium]
YAMHNVAPTTRRRYAEFLRIHVIPTLGNIKLKELKPAQIQRFYTDRINYGLSTTTVLHIHRVLHLALKYAIQWQYIQYNPVDACKPPRLNKKDLEVLSDSQLQLLFDTVKEEAVFIPIFIAATTGMRLGEVCGLQNEDVDIQNKIFTIRKSFKRISGEMKLNSTKTHRSKRPVPMLPGTEKVLLEYIRKKKSYKVQFLSSYKDSEHFCVWQDGSPILPDYVTKVFKKYSRRLGFSESISFHSLRHTHASWLLRQGVNPKVVSERLGHTSVNITLNTYSHLMPNTQKDIINSLNTEIFTQKNDVDSTGLIVQYE